MKNFNVSTKNDLKQFIEDKAFKKILVIAGNKSFELSGLKNFLTVLKIKILNIFSKNVFFQNILS